MPNTNIILAASSIKTKEATIENSRMRVPKSKAVAPISVGYRPSLRTISALYARPHPDQGVKKVILCPESDLEKAENTRERILSSEPSPANKNSTKNLNETMKYNERFYVGPDPVDPN